MGHSADMELAPSSIVGGWTLVERLGAGGGISAYHFQATSNAEYRVSPGNVTDRDATAIHTQAFYIVGPTSSTF